MIRFQIGSCVMFSSAYLSAKASNSIILYGIVLDTLGVPVCMHACVQQNFEQDVDKDLLTAVLTP